MERARVRDIVAISHKGVEMWKVQCSVSSQQGVEVNQSQSVEKFKFVI